MKNVFKTLKYIAYMVQNLLLTINNLWFYTIIPMNNLFLSEKCVQD